MTSLLDRHLEAVRGALRSGEQIARKRFGQHFLLQAPVLRKIAAAAGEDLDGWRVLEVGAGPGGLTAALLEAGARVAAFEIDRDWVDFLTRHLGDEPGCTIHARDVMAERSAVLRAAAGEGEGQAYLIANLPYQIAATLLLEVLLWLPPLRAIVVTIQKELADRLLAPAGGAARGRLSVLAQMQSRVERCLLLPAGAFTPPPKVRSAVVRLTPQAEQVERFRDHPWMGGLLQIAFRARRKMLRSSLGARLSPEQLGVLDPVVLKRRPQDLDVEEWWRLGDELATRAGAPAPNLW